jgi:hypothetical protein
MVTMEIVVRIYVVKNQPNCWCVFEVFDCHTHTKATGESIILLQKLKKLLYILFSNF